MICDKCGKSNIKGVIVCAYCGEKMPLTSDGGGFKDILSFASDSVEANGKQKNANEGINEEDMKNLLKKSDSIISTTRKNILISLIAGFISLLVLVSSVITCVLAINLSKGDVEDKEETKIETKEDEENKENKENKEDKEDKEDKNEEINKLQEEIEKFKEKAQKYDEITGRAEKLKDAEADELEKAQAIIKEYRELFDDSDSGDTQE